MHSNQIFKFYTPVPYNVTFNTTTKFLSRNYYFEAEAWPTFRHIATHSPTLFLN